MRHPDALAAALPPILESHRARIAGSVDKSRVDNLSKKEGDRDCGICKHDPFARNYSSHHCNACSMVT